MADNDFEKMMRDKFFTEEDVEEEVVVVQGEVVEPVAKKTKAKRGRVPADSDNQKVNRTYRLSESTINALEVYAFEKKREKGNNISSISAVIEEALKSYIPKKYFN